VKNDAVSWCGQNKSFKLAEKVISSPKIQKIKCLIPAIGQIKQRGWSIFKFQCQVCKVICEDDKQKKEKKRNLKKSFETFVKMTVILHFFSTTKCQLMNFD
jgi:hypothetical protein